MDIIFFKSTHHLFLPFSPLFMIGHYGYFESFASQSTAGSFWRTNGKRESVEALQVVNMGSNYRVEWRLANLYAQVDLGSYVMSWMSWLPLTTYLCKMGLLPDSYRFSFKITHKVSTAPQNTWPMSALRWKHHSKDLFLEKKDHNLSCKQ